MGCGITSLNIFFQLFLNYSFLLVVLFLAVHQATDSSDVILVHNRTSDDDDFDRLMNGEWKHTRNT